MRVWGELPRLFVSLNEIGEVLAIDATGFNRN